MDRYQHQNLSLVLLDQAVKLPLHFVKGLLLHKLPDLVDTDAKLPVKRDSHDPLYFLKIIVAVSVARVSRRMHQTLLFVEPDRIRRKACV